MKAQIAGKIRTLLRTSQALYWLFLFLKNEGFINFFVELKNKSLFFKDRNRQLHPNFYSRAATL